jgi:hypothetical protein
MTTTTAPLHAATPSPTAAPGSRACVRHGLQDEVVCAACQAQTYDLTRADERREVRALRRMLLKKRRAWPFIAAAAAATVPGFVAGLAHGMIVFEVSVFPALVGLGAGFLAARFLKRPALARLDAAMEVHKS